MRRKKGLEQLGLLLIKERLDEPFIVMNGDILTLIDFSKFYDFGIKKDSSLSGEKRNYPI